MSEALSGARFAALRGFWGRLLGLPALDFGVVPGIVRRRAAVAGKATLGDGGGVFLPQPQPRFRSVPGLGVRGGVGDLASAALPVSGVRDGVPVSERSGVSDPGIALSGAVGSVSSGMVMTRARVLPDFPATSGRNFGLRACLPRVGTVGAGSLGALDVVHAWAGVDFPGFGERAEMRLVPPPVRRESVREALRAEDVMSQGEAGGGWALGLGGASGPVGASDFGGAQVVSGSFGSDAPGVAVGRSGLGGFAPFMAGSEPSMRAALRRGGAGVDEWANPQFPGLSVGY